MIPLIVFELFVLTVFTIKVEAEFSSPANTCAITFGSICKSLCCKCCKYNGIWTLTIQGGQVKNTLYIQNSCYLHNIEDNITHNTYNIQINLFALLSPYHLQEFKVRARISHASYIKRLFVYVCVSLCVCHQFSKLL